MLAAKRTVAYFLPETKRPNTNCPLDIGGLRSKKLFRKKQKRVEDSTLFKSGKRLN
jgi:hypothetical protein